MLNNFVLPYCENSQCSIALHKFSFDPCSAVLLWLYVSCSGGKHVHTTHLRTFKRLLTVPRNYTCAFFLTHAVVFVSQAILSPFFSSFSHWKSGNAETPLSPVFSLASNSCRGTETVNLNREKKYGDGSRCLPLLKTLDFSGAQWC